MPKGQIFQQTKSDSIECNLWPLSIIIGRQFELRLYFNRCCIIWLLKHPLGIYLQGWKSGCPHRCHTLRWSIEVDVALPSAAVVALVAASSSIFGAVPAYTITVAMADLIIIAIGWRVCSHYCCYCCCSYCRALWYCFRDWLGRNGYSSNVWSDAWKHDGYCIWNNFWGRTLKQLWFSFQWHHSAFPFQSWRKCVALLSLYRKPRGLNRECIIGNEFMHDAFVRGNDWNAIHHAFRTSITHQMMHR